MTNIEAFHFEYERALKVKRELDQFKTTLTRLGKNCERERDEYTAQLRTRHPKLVEQMREAYTNGERIKNEMMQGGRWPKYDSREVGTTYTSILASVPVEQRSLELENCAGWWAIYERVRLEIDALYPPPKYFRWNGTRLVGPSFQEFGINEMGDYSVT